MQSRKPKYRIPWNQTVLAAVATAVLLSGLALSPAALADPTTSADPAAPADETDLPPGDRPPLTDLSLKDEIEQLIRERKEIYRQAAHTIIDTDTLDFEEVLCELEHIWRTVPRHDLR